MDFSRLQSVEKINPIAQKFDIQWKPGKETFRLSDNMFNKMDLEYNSLRQFDDVIASEVEGESDELVGVFLAVCPGNSGKFHKKLKGKSKGKTFKNGALSSALISLGVTPDNLAIEYKGKNGDLEMYQLLAVNSTSIEEPIAVSEDSSENVSVTNDQF